MKDWTDITAISLSNPRPKNYGPESCGPEALGLSPPGIRIPSPLALGFQIIAVLLAGLCRVFGLSRWEKDVQRDRAYRVRGAIAAAILEYDTAVNNAEVTANWSGERYVWWLQMKAIWVDSGDDIYNRKPRAATLFDKPFRGHRPRSRNLLATALQIRALRILRQISRPAGQDNHIIKPPP